MAASEKPEKTAYVYMVRCAGGQLYTGWTNDPEARLKAHQSGKGAKYTRTHTALGFAYLEACGDFWAHNGKRNGRGWQRI